MSLRSRIRSSIRTRVMLLVLATTISALVLSAAGLVIYDLRSYERQWTNDLVATAEVLARASAPALAFNDRRTAAGDLSVMKARARILAVALYTREGELFATYNQPGVKVAFPTHPEPNGYRVDDDHLVLFRRVVENGEPIGTVYLRALYRPYERLRDYITIIAGVMVASLAAAALFSSWLQVAVTGPILAVAGVAHQVMQKRDYSLRAAKTTEDEIGELVDAFNGMLAEVARRAEALREADRRKDEFLATLAHELRNPLAPLRNALEILRIAGNDPERAARAREMMERQLNQMVRLVDDLLDVSRITTGKLAVRKTVVELQGVVRDALETVRPFIESRQHTLELHLADEPIMVNADRTRLGQVFANLLNNAAKYTHPGGHITLGLAREGSEGVVRVRDNGIGLAPESVASIFDMFVQLDRSLERSQAGLGVGLTLARRLVELHDGEISAHSEGTGRGSEFVVRLPVTQAAAVPAAQAAAQRKPGAARRILLADDNVDFANSLGHLLETHGHTVRVVHDGAQALEAATHFEPDIAFLDIGMPKIHGYELARRLKAQPRTARCMLVAVTGWGQEDDRKRAREAGFDRHLVKPVDPGQIEAIVESVKAPA
ncbi:MAG TPA: ATP-binding protein [Usitatibacter sp.]|nr:ATP-binding protein [Usitatibacter sp.]